MQQKMTASAIILGSLLIAGAILVKDYTPTQADSSIQEAKQVIPLENLTRKDNAHVYGNENASIRIVEFSDFECPFCSRLHPTLKRVVDESDGKISWEYRHLPLPNHKGAFDKAVASECVAREIGNDAFWSYTDTLLADLRADGEEYYVEEAVKLGANAEDFRACLGEIEMQKLVENDRQVANDIGGRGTPFSVIIGSDDSTTPVSGALPYEEWVRTLRNIN